MRTFIFLTALLIAIFFPEVGYKRHYMPIQNGTADGVWQFTMPPSPDAVYWRVATIVVIGVLAIAINFIWDYYSTKEIVRRDDLLKIKDEPLKGEVLMPIRGLPAPKCDD